MLNNMFMLTPDFHLLAFEGFVLLIVISTFVLCEVGAGWSVRECACAVVLLQ